MWIFWLTIGIIIGTIGNAFFFKLGAKAKEVAQDARAEFEKHKGVK